MAFLDQWLHDDVLQLVCMFPVAWGGCLKVEWQVLVAEMAARPPCSALFNVFVEEKMFQSFPPGKAKTPR